MSMRPSCKDITANIHKALTRTWTANQTSLVLCTWYIFPLKAKSFTTKKNIQKHFQVINVFYESISDEHDFHFAIKENFLIKQTCSSFKIQFSTTIFLTNFAYSSQIIINIQMYLRGISDKLTILYSIHVISFYQP